MSFLREARFRDIKLEFLKYGGDFCVRIRIFGICVIKQVELKL